jgi:hypothetical protein
MAKIWTEVSLLEDLFPGITVGRRVRIYPSTKHGWWDPHSPTEGIIEEVIPSNENPFVIRLSAYKTIQCHSSELYIILEAD